MDSAAPTAVEVNFVNEISPGDKIWYRNKADTFIHQRWVHEIKDRVFSVRDVEKSLYRVREPFWLDKQMIEVLEIERPEKTGKSDSYRSNRDLISALDRLLLAIENDQLLPDSCSQVKDARAALANHL